MCVGMLGVGYVCVLGRVYWILSMSVCTLDVVCVYVGRRIRIVWRGYIGVRYVLRGVGFWVVYWVLYFGVWVYVHWMLRVLGVVCVGCCMFVLALCVLSVGEGVWEFVCTLDNCLCIWMSDVCECRVCRYCERERVCVCVYVCVGLSLKVRNSFREGRSGTLSPFLYPGLPLNTNLKDFKSKL